VVFPGNCLFRQFIVAVRGSNPGGTRFSASAQTSPKAHPASYIMGTESFPGVKRPGRGVDHPPPSKAEVKKRVELYLYSPSGPSWPFIGWTLPLPLPSSLLWYKSFLCTWYRNSPGNKTCGVVAWEVECQCGITQKNTPAKEDHAVECLEWVCSS